MLAFLRPFKVGEEIFVTQGSNFRGSHDPTVSDYLVREIGWYQTTLEAKDTKPTISCPTGISWARTSSTSRGRKRGCSSWNFACCSRTER